MNPSNRNTSATDLLYTTEEKTTLVKGIGKKKNEKRSKNLHEIGFTLPEPDVP
jgi:hypothetical protein